MPCKPLWVCSLTCMHAGFMAALCRMRCRVSCLSEHQCGGLCRVLNVEERECPLPDPAPAVDNTLHATSFSTFHSSGALSMCVWESVRGWSVLQLLSTQHMEVQKSFMNLRVNESTTKHLCLKGKHVNKRSWGMCAMCAFVCALTCLCWHLQLLTHKPCLWWVKWNTLVHKHSSHFFSP